MYLNTRKTKNLIKKWEEDLNSHFFKEKFTDPNRKPF